MQAVKSKVRHFINHIARWVNAISGGHMTPNHITLISLVAHVPIALLIAQGNFLLAGGLLVIFGLFDTLDGELARVQQRSSAFGAFFDSTSDRIKEASLYVGLAYYFSISHQPLMVAVAVMALGISFSISYINAAGDIAVAGKPRLKIKKNAAFRNGLAGFEVRIGLLILGLLVLQPALAVAGICVLGLPTVYQRFINVKRTLQ